MAIEFYDGEAAGVVLELRRAPVMLRVVRDKAGNWDGCDQLDDEPREGEAVFLYIIAVPPVSGFVDGRDPKTGRRYGHPFCNAAYCAYPPAQPHALFKPNYPWPAAPSEEILRRTSEWHAWCDTNKDNVRNGINRPEKAKADRE